MSYIKKLTKFQKQLKIKFKDTNLLVKAFTHSSYANEHEVECNERLEFLGDAVLQIAVSDFLYENFPKEDEGFLSKKRAKNVCEQALCIVAKNMNLSDYVLLGKGEEMSGGRHKCSTLSDTFEAVIGAVYLDRGYNFVLKILDRFLFPNMIDDDLILEKDYKSSLQEYVQADGRKTLVYKLVKETGPAHKKIFEMAVYMDRIKLGTGKGRTKKEAEQSAAKEAISKLARSKGGK